MKELTRKQTETICGGFSTLPAPSRNPVGAEFQMTPEEIERLRKLLDRTPEILP